MNAMQYAITLPADYDMAIIRTRVATRGHMLDDVSGLVFKAYCIQERGIHGALVNQYAPFYLWRDADAQVDFLRGDGFRGVCESFGRPSVEHWVAIAVTHGRAHQDGPGWAVRTVEDIRSEEFPSVALERAERRHRDLAGRPSLHTSVTALDPLRWQVVHFTLWREPPTGFDGSAYRVLHLSRPRESSNYP